jgi:aminocarboxymuconate-semialdehyde decarboxylase
MIPKRYLKELERRTKFPFFRTGIDGKGFIEFSEKSWLAVTPLFVETELRMKEMDKYGITTQLLSGTNPWTDSFPSGDLAYEFAKLINDETAEIVSKSNGRFLGLATLPLLSPENAAQELSRALDELGLAGAIIATNVNGAYLSDRGFLPIFEAASKKRCLLFLHPTNPLGLDKLRENGMVRSLGYTFDTTLCLVKMAYSGLFDRYPNLNILAAHLAGNVPYIAGRIDTAWKNIPESRGELDERPSSKIRKVLYADTISYSPSAIRFAAEFLGIDRLIFGTDFPFEWGIKDATDSVEATFTDSQLKAIYSENLGRILNS